MQDLFKLFKNQSTCSNFRSLNTNILSFLVALFGVCPIFGYAQDYETPEFIGRSDHEIVEALVSVLIPYLLDFDIDACGLKGDCPKIPLNQDNLYCLKKRIAQVIQKKRPLAFSLLAFPFKSSNRDQNVIGSQVDMAECYSLQYLQNMVSALQKIYPKTSLTLITDGLFFNDLFAISDQDVRQYEKGLKALIKDLPDLYLVTMGVLLQKDALKIEDVRREIDTAFQAEHPLQRSHTTRHF